MSLQLIANKLERLVWRKRLWGVDERQVWHVVGRLDEMYRQLYQEQRLYYEALLQQGRAAPQAGGRQVGAPQAGFQQAGIPQPGTPQPGFQQTPSGQSASPGSAAATRPMTSAVPQTQAARPAQTQQPARPAQQQVQVLRQAPSQSAHKPARAAHFRSAP